MAASSQPSDASMAVVPTETLVVLQVVEQTQRISSFQKSWELFQDVGARASIHESRWLHSAGLSTQLLSMAPPG